MSSKLTHYKTFRGTLTALTGLRIGGSKESIEVGGLENTIIRHPITDLPYIPGSSIKGKMRSLLEHRLGRISDKGEPCGCGNCMVCRVFGPHKNVRHQLGPTRILVRDAALTPDCERDLKLAQKERGLNFAEVKTENLVNRNTGTAEHPRTQERVPAGIQFDFEIAVRIFENDNEAEMVDFVKQGLTLLQQDYLGSSGSRGYGKVQLDYQVV